MFFSKRFFNPIILFTRSKHIITNNKHIDLNYLKEIFVQQSKTGYYEIVRSKNHDINKLSRSAVLVPISIKQEQDNNGHKTNRTFYTMSKRTKNIKTFKGQVCFLGGRHDSTDNNDIQTAYRESFEEAGVDSKSLHFLAELCPVITTNGSIITPVVAYFDKTEFRKKLNEHEVELIFDVPTESFLLSEMHTHSSIKSNKHTEYFIHTFKHELADQMNPKTLSITGVTAFISIVVSSILHSKSPEFILDPQLNFKHENSNEFLENYLLDKSKYLISYLAKNKKIKNDSDI
jgi:8-oxo-dGTP pyrophosphatase MutT (NUDIX family)